MSRRLFLLAAGLVAAAAFAPRVARTARAAQGSAHAFSFENIDGGPLNLSDFAGRPMLVVNTASRCGFTPQYDQLQAVWSRFRDRGLVVLGVPSNDFRQELASEAAVRDFCETNFGIDFPMTTITRVTGRDAHPFYAWIGEALGQPRWNFHKYLVDGDGRPVAAFPTGTRPDAPEVIAAIEKLLPST
ncbi:MAG: glutathione peroxidase [Rhodobacteraceae bacterium]|nr:MAG: glutathione peroxidase [Paracoccaceae bacterium]